MNGPASAIAGQLRHIQSLLNDTLTNEGSIAVNEQWNHGEIRIAQDILLRADNALKNAVSGLEMRRIGSKRNLRCYAVFRGIYAFGTQVILDVAGPLDSARILISFELGENLGIALPSKISQNIQAPAVSHCNGNLVDPVVCGLIQDLVQKWDQ